MSDQSADGIGELQVALAQLTGEVKAGSVAVTTEYTQILEARVKRHASQPRTRLRPRGAEPEGPRLLTGTYVGTIHSDVDVGAVSATGSVGSNDDRALPLEHGTPNLFGRGITMQPYPHFAPAMDETEDEFYAALAASVAAATQRTRGGRLRSLIGRLFGRAS